MSEKIQQAIITYIIIRLQVKQQFSTRLNQMDLDKSFSSVSEEESEESHDLDDLQLLQQARREQVLKNMNIGDYSEQQKNEQVMQILQRKKKRQERNAKNEQEKDLKRMRARNAHKFFIKMKILMMNEFKKEIFEARKSENHCKQEVSRMLSYLNINTIKEFQKLKQIKKIKIKEFLHLMELIFTKNDLDLQDQIKYRIFWSLAMYFKLPICKICFIDISHIQLETFYNLKYKPSKAKTKKISKQVDLIKNKIQRKITQEEMTNEIKNIIPLSAYSFNSEASQSVVSTSSLQNVISASSENLKKIRQKFKDSFFNILCPISQKWLIVNAETLQTYEIQYLKQKIFEGRAIVGFYAIRMINLKQNYQFLYKERRFNNIEFRDLTHQFCDKNQNIIKRRTRLGLKSIYKNLIKESHFYKTLQIFEEDEKHIIQSFNNIEQEIAKSYFPTTVKAMKMSQYYVVPSLIDKYKILKEDAKPIQNLQFHDEKVYRKKDLIRVASRMGWIDLWRMVKQTEQPIKTTQTRTKKQTKLYQFSQTQPFELRVDEMTGDFVLDEDYNSIYIPPNFVPPEGMSIIPQNIDYICKKHKFKCSRLVQGFNLASLHIVPNNIGFLVYNHDIEEIMKLYKERQEQLRIKKEARKDDNTIGLWKKLFKSILITQQIG